VKDDRAIKKLTRAAFLCLLFMCVEFAGGILAHSLAVMTDAAHLFSDIVSFAISITAIMISRQASTTRMSFGFHRVEILGATFSIFMIWALTAYLVVAAAQRLIEHDSAVDGRIMFATASFGLLVNILMAVILGHEGHMHGHGHGGEHGHTHGGHGHSHGIVNQHSEHSGHSHDNDGDDHHHEDHCEEFGAQHSHSDSSCEGEALSKNASSQSDNLNVRAAYIHVIGDFVQTTGIFIAAAVIWHNPEYWYMDPICTFLFSILVVFTTIPILKESVLVLMESTPAGVGIEEVEETLMTVKGIAEVHDLHIWTIGSGKIALAVHVSQDPASGSNSCDILHIVQETLFRKYGIDHSTIQVEECKVLECVSDVGCGQSLHAHRSTY
jgi:zinc transporter 2